MKLLGKGLLAAALLGLMSTTAMADPITPFDLQSGAVNVPITHPGPPALTPNIATSEIYFPAVPEHHRIRDLNVNVDATLDWGGAYRFHLIAPDGTTVYLGRPIGPDGDFIGIRFDDTGAAPPMMSGGGTFRPLESLGAMRGVEPEGVWTLAVSSYGYWGPGGTIHGWSMDGTYGPNPEPGSMALCALGAIGLVWHRRRRRNKQTA